MLIPIEGRFTTHSSLSHPTEAVIREPSVTAMARYRWGVESRRLAVSSACERDTVLAGSFVR